MRLPPARGEPVTRRTGVWAFGCVVYETLTGLRAFPGTRWSDSIGLVREREPDWSCLAGRNPARTSNVFKRCLQKDQKERLRYFADTKLGRKDLLIVRSSGVPTAAGRAPPLPESVASLWPQEQ